MRKEIGTFTVTVPAGATLPLTPPQESTDWKHVGIQLDVIENRGAAGDLKFSLATAVDKDEYPLWAPLPGEEDLPADTGDSVFQEWSAGFRCWFVVQVRNDTAGAIKATFRATALYKERTT